MNLKIFDIINEFAGLNDFSSYILKETFRKLDRQRSLFSHLFIVFFLSFFYVFGEIQKKKVNIFFLFCFFV